MPGNAPFKGHKATYFQGGIRIPLFVYLPEKIKSGFRSDLLVSNLDILPTLIDAAGGRVPDSIDGKSLLPILTKKSDKPVHDYLFWVGLHSRYWGYTLDKSLKNDASLAPYAWAIVKGDYFLRYVGTIVPNLYTDIIDGRQPVFELYNRRSDPGETMNLIDKMPDKANELMSLYYSRAKSFHPSNLNKINKWKEMLPPEK